MPLARVVVADDQPRFLRIVSELLYPEFLTVGAFSNGAELLRQINDLDPAIVILDISMGEMSGFEIAQVLRERKFSGKIVFLSVHEEPEIVDHAIQDGAAGFVFKSRMVVDLKIAILAVLDGGTYLSSDSPPEF